MSYVHDWKGSSEYYTALMLFYFVDTTLFRIGPAR
uniref:Uncharacterized protein n=1 Tax=Rhizophora mucronata TaxID=61149 RepID=A0A2P2NU73_RHIMU